MLHCEHFLFVLSLFNPFCFNVLGQKKKKSIPPTPVFFVPRDFSLLCPYAFLIVTAQSRCWPTQHKVKHIIYSSESMSLWGEVVDESGKHWTLYAILSWSSYPSSLVSHWIYFTLRWNSLWRHVLICVCHGKGSKPLCKFGGAPIADLITPGQKSWVEMSIRNHGLFYICLYLGRV